MKLIIDIPVKVHENAQNSLLCGTAVLVDAVKNGIPLTEVVAKIKALDTDCHVVYAVAIDDVSQILEKYMKGEQEC